MSWVGFNQVEVEYVREERWAGVTKYSFRKMFKLSLDAMTSFSYKPLKLASYIGIMLTVFSFFYLIVLLSLKLFTTKIVSGVFILLGITFFFDGIILMALGIIGEYIARTHEESKQRPLYIVAEKIGFQKEGNQT
jgi:dolichol-phosphate mannosyltransferase